MARTASYLTPVWAVRVYDSEDRVLWHYLTVQGDPGSIKVQETWRNADRYAEFRIYGSNVVGTIVLRGNKPAYSTVTGPSGETSWYSLSGYPLPRQFKSTNVNAVKTYSMDIETEKVGNTIVNKRRELEALEARRDALLETERRIAELKKELAARPKEPPVDSVISFERAYERNGKKYSWVAYRAVGNRWYLTQDGTGRAQLPSMTWDDLLDFIDGNTIFLATKWDELK